MKNTIAIVFLVIVAGLSAPAFAGATTGKAAPEFTLPSMSGSNLRLKEQRGKVVMLNFWATWCGPCRQEMPLLDKLYRQYRSKGFQLLGVNIDNDKKNASNMARKLGVSFPVLFDPEKKTADSYGVSAMPYTVMIDRDGVVRSVHKGYVPGTEKKYENEIRTLLGR